MTIRLPALTTGGMLLTTLLLFAASTAAQASPPALTTLHTFAGPRGDGTSPLASVAIGSGGVLYGTTASGGSGSCINQFLPPGCGTVFSLTPPASPDGAWGEAVLYNFTGGSDGANPNAGVVIGSGGVLFGTTDSDGTAPGTSGYGTVFSLSPPASPGGAWTQTTLYSFTGGSDGANPYAPVAIGRDGALDGTTTGGGTSGAGTVFSLTPPASPGGAWTETVLHNFTGGAGGRYPFGGLTIGANGVLFGTTLYGGTSFAGTVFALTPPASAGGAWRKHVLYNFLGPSLGDGYMPAGIVAGSGGVLYGITSAGGITGYPCGKAGCGTVFSLTPPASPGGAWTESVLHAFAAFTDGYSPNAGMAIGIDGVLYGTTFGNRTVFAVTPPSPPGGSWTEAVLHTFTGGSDGGDPGGLAIDKRGVLLGTTYDGGTSNDGTVFALKP